ncbi:MAG: hypothetical protein R3F55_25980, partial [Alphaproteobacteria bacterium]
MSSSISSSDAIGLAGAGARASAPGYGRLIGIFAMSLGLVVAVMALATEWLLRTQVEPQDSWALHQRLLQAPVAPGLAFGDSHVARGFDAPDGWLNLAYPSQTVEQMAADVRAALAVGTPQRVILQADPHMFAPYRLVREGAEDGAQASSGPLLADPRHRAQLVAYWAAFVASGGSLQSGIEQTPRGSLLSPGDLSGLPARRQTFDARARAATHHPYAGFADSGSAAAYEAVVAELAAHGVAVCLVSLPVSPAYLDGLAETAAGG